MPTFPQSKTCLNSIEFDFFKKVLTRRGDNLVTPSNRRALYAVLTYLEDDSQFLDFLEAFAGRTIKVPSRQYLNSVKKNAQIFAHCKQYGKSSTMEKFRLTEEKLQRILSLIEVSSEVSDE